MIDRGPVVVDTDVYSRVVIAAAVTADYVRYQPLLQGRPLVLAAQTVAELRAGALMRSWGAERVARLEEKIARAAVVPVNDDLTHQYAQLKAACSAIGNALCQKQHDGDRWIAATALHLGLPLVSNDGIYQGTPGLVLL